MYCTVHHIHVLCTFDLGVILYIFVFIGGYYGIHTIITCVTMRLRACIFSYFLNVLEYHVKCMTCNYVFYLKRI